MFEAIFVIFVVVDVLLMGAAVAHGGDSDGTGGCS